MPPIRWLLNVATQVVGGVRTLTANHDPDDCEAGATGFSTDPVAFVSYSYSTVIHETVLGTIANLVAEFTPNPIHPIDSRVKLDDPFLHAFDLLRNVDEVKRDETIHQAFRLYREERHYSLNIATLLYYFLYYLARLKPQTDKLYA